MNQARNPKQLVHPVTREEIWIKKGLLASAPTTLMKEPPMKTMERMNPH